MTTTIKLVYPEFEVAQLRSREGILFEFVQGNERLGSALLPSQAEAEAYAQQRFPFAHKRGLTIRALTPATADVETPTLDGSLQALIDAGDDLAAAEDAMIDALFAPVDDEDEPIFALDLIDCDAELDDLREDMLDREWHSRGMW